MRKMLSLLSMLILLATNSMSFIAFADDVDNNVYQEQSDTELDNKELDAVEIVNQRKDAVVQQENPDIQENESSNEIDNNQTLNQNDDTLNKSTSESNYNIDVDNLEVQNDDVLDNFNNSEIISNPTINILGSSEEKYDWRDCYEYEYNDYWTLSLNKYTCEYTDIIIPASESWDDKISVVKHWAFEWKVINSLTIQTENYNFRTKAFSWAIFNGDITIDENNIWNELYWFIVSKNWRLTIKKNLRIYYVDIEWDLVLDLEPYMKKHNIPRTSISYFIVNSNINWNVEIKWLTWWILSSFMNSKISKNSKIVLGEWIDSIESYSFWFKDVYPLYSSETLWEISFPSTLTSISKSFNNTIISGNIKLPSLLNSISNSFQDSQINWNINIEWLNNDLNISSFLNKSLVIWDIHLSWFNMNLYDVNPNWVSWDVKISNSNFNNFNNFFYTNNPVVSWNMQFINVNIDENWWSYFNGLTINEDLIFSWETIRFWTSNCRGLKLWWDLKIIWNDINFPTSDWMQIWWSINIFWNNIGFRYWFNNLDLSWDMIVIWENFEDLWPQTMDNMNIWWNLLLSWNNLVALNNSMEWLNIWWDFEIKSNLLNIKSWVLNWVNVSWDFKLPDVLILWYWVLQWWNIKWTNYINVPSKETIQYRNILWNLYIENADNTPVEEFSWISIWKNIYLNWEISKVWASAYAFASWTIQPITLSNDFQTWDIGENAFCINWKPVVAYTMKEVSQEDRNYLLQHACLDIKSAFNITFNVDWNIETLQYNWRNTDDIPSPTKNWYEFLWWFEENSKTPFDFENTPITEDKTLFAKWKALEDKAQENAAENIVYTNETTVTIWDDVQEEKINNSSLINLVSKEVEPQEVKEEDDKTKVQESEIQVTSDKKVEYQGWLEVYLEKTENVWTENEETKRIEWTAKFSSPVAVKIPITSSAEAVKVQVKHEWEEFGYKGLTINPINSCLNWEAVNDKYNWESISVKEWAEWKYTLIYTCSASTFVAYTENKKSADNTAVATPSAWGWRSINTTSNTQDQEHNSADINEQKENKASTTASGNTVTVEENIKNYGNIKLTRWEVAVMTNILLDVFPQLVEWKQELDDVENACSNYADEQKFTKDEKKAITRLCKLSIMWIHADNNRPLEEFLVNNNTTNDEFSKVINRSISTYNEKDLSTVKDALKKLENNEDDVVFWTLYDMFMSIKNVLN